MDALNDRLQNLAAVAAMLGMCLCCLDSSGRAHTLRHKLLYCFPLASYAVLPKCAGCECQYPHCRACKETHQAVELSVITTITTLYIPDAVVKVKPPRRIISFAFNKNSVVMARAKQAVMSTSG